MSAAMNPWLSRCRDWHDERGKRFIERLCVPHARRPYLVAAGGGLHKVVPRQQLLDLPAGAGRGAWTRRSRGWPTLAWSTGTSIWVSALAVALICCCTCQHPHGGGCLAHGNGVNRHETPHALQSGPQPPVCPLPRARTFVSPDAHSLGVLAEAEEVVGLGGGGVHGRVKELGAGGRGQDRHTDEARRHTAWHCAS